MVKIITYSPSLTAINKDFVAFSKHNDKAIALAMNAAGAKATTAALRNIYDAKFNSDPWNVRAKDIKAMVMRPKKATKSNHTYVFGFKSKGGSSLLDFTRTHDKRSQNKQGVRYKIKKKGGSKVFRHAFINESTKRRGQDFAMLRKGSPRYPVIPLAVVSPSYMFAQSHSTELFISTFQTTFKKSYLQKIDYLMSKSK